MIAGSDLAGYKIGETLYNSNRTLIFRATRTADGGSVIIKTLNPKFASANEFARLQHEYQITRKVQADGIIRVYEQLAISTNDVALVLEDFGGLSLDELVEEIGPLDVERFLDLAISICKSIGKVHEKNIIHKDINPYNIIYNRQTGRTQLIDFGISTELSREKQNLCVADCLQGTLPYMSPEQTGRMNRAIDYRTDFYSLGVTFYKVLTGTLPFQAEDAAGWVYCHIARSPRAPGELNPKVPNAVSAIVLKLLAKNVEDRYQSSAGIIRDLEQCRSQLRTTGRIDAFELGRKDISEKFQVPQALIGREQEVAELLGAFDRAAVGGVRVPPRVW